MKKFLSLFLIFIFSFSLLLSCGDKTEEETQKSESSDESQPHIHTFGSTWVFNEKGHYKDCTCHPEAIQIFEHRDSTDKDGRCDVCQYTMREATTFTLIVKDQNGNAIPGVEIKIYSSSQEKTSLTDENGTVSCDFIYYEKVRALIKSIPEGYERLTDTLYSFEESTLEIVIPTI